MTVPRALGADLKAVLGEARRLDRAGLTREAIDAYRRVLEAHPNSPNTWYNLAKLQRKIRQFSEALASYQQALDRGISRPEEVLLNRGVIYADHLRQDDAAEHELLSALALNPTYVPALLNLGNLHEDRGHQDLAGDMYRRALAVDPSCSLALARYANLTSFSTRDDALIERLQRALADINSSSADRADLGFALGRALDACGDYATAFEAYRIANLHSRDSGPPGLRRYDPRAFERLVDRLIAAFPMATRPPPVMPSGAPPQPIFICGMFRSGSTLTEQILAGHPRITDGGELDLLPTVLQQLAESFPESAAAASPQRMETLASEYLRSLANLFPNAEFVTDKRPNNFLYIGVLKRLFPTVKIVHTTRDALDNCLSVFFLQLDHGMSYALDLLDTGHYYAQYRRLMAHWKSLYGDDIIDMPYDTLVREPIPVTGSLLAALELEWDERCLAVPSGRSIKTASVWQVREPIHGRSSGRAKNYVSQLASLRHYLERQARIQGYAHGRWDAT